MLSACCKPPKDDRRLYLDEDSDDQTDTSEDYQVDEEYLDGVRGLLEYSAVEAELFQSPVAIQMSGGTAAFFTLTCVGEAGPLSEPCPPHYWIGKDLARARDEIDFYEEMKNLDPKQYRLLSRWAFRYAGILRAPCYVANKKGKQVLEDEARELLVLQNLRDGKKSIRMLDIKIGQDTAVAGWKHKSFLSACQQHCIVDSHTNSATGGFRLEGFDNPPTILRTRLAGAPTRCHKIGKRYKRVVLQRLDGEEFLRYFVDVADFHEMEQSADAITPMEYAEAVLFDTVQKLAGVCADTLTMPVPQMWIGSSVGIVCDGERLPERSTVDPALRMNASAPNAQGLAQVYVFDWGRSELNTVEKAAGMSSRQRKQFQNYWKQYQRGVARIFYDAAHVYFKKFTSTVDSDCFLRIEVWDYDTVEANDLIGSVEWPLAATDGIVEAEIDCTNICGCSADPGIVRFEIIQIAPFVDSRLQSQWQVIIHNVEGIPTLDLFSETDAVVVCTIVSEDGVQGPRASTPVEWNCNNPTFDCTLDFAQVRSDIRDSLIMIIAEQLQVSPKEASQDFFEDDFEDFLSSVPSLMHLAK